MKSKQSRAKYISAILFGLAMMLVMLLARSVFALTDPMEIFSLLCDACFVPGMLLTGVGALLYIASDGLFDIFAFGLQKVIRLSSPKERQARTSQTFYEYGVMKRKSRKTGFGYMYMLVIGGVFLAAAIVFLLLSAGI